MQLTNGGSDCAAIIHAFIKNGYNLREACATLDGVFAFLMADDKNLYIGRDPLGVRPLFYGFTSGGALVLGSEVKCIEQLCDRMDYFPPGCCSVVPLLGRGRSIQIQQYYSVPNIADRFLSMENAQTLIREVLVKSVEKRLMGNRQFGFMLSGGLDSSLIASIASKFLAQKPIAFSVGFEDSPDLENAKRVAEFLNIPHKVLVITPKECIDIIPEVIYALETFDPLIIRCGVAHYLLCKYISQTSEVKVLLSGEGADELFGSYAYMQRAPNTFHLHKEILRRLKYLHQYDVLRCDRSTSCHGLEIRVPFLDKSVYITLISIKKRCMIDHRKNLLSA
uniref:Glutamine-dependent asparagine synthetase n=1 Tax=Heterorhabditis bacteriophora TaxID=37862 RepID=A0A1I7XKY0_HETBA